MSQASAFSSSVCFIFLNALRNKKLRMQSLEFVSSTIQFVSMLAGCYFVVFMFKDGFISYGAFYLVSFLVSLTCVKKPLFSSIMLVLFFLGLTAYLGIFILPFSDWVGELLVASLFVVLLLFGNFLNYRRHLSLFLQDKKISKLNRVLEKLSQTDELTGIYNRRKSMELVSEYVDFAKRYADPFCVAILDIDRFKRVNDKFGHNTGDIVLRQFSDAIKSRLRSTDIFGRWGGEEFIILIQKSDIKGAYTLLEILREHVASVSFESVGHLTFSGGVCLFNGEKSASELIGKADSALYKAKELGRNQVQIYE